MLADIVLFDCRGQVVMRISNFKAKRATRAAVMAMSGVGAVLGSLFEPHFVERALPVSPKLLANGQIAILQRPWASLDTRHAYEKRNLDKQKHAGESSCARDRRRGIVVFPAVVLDEEKDDKSCINKNRDKLVQAFCNFRDSFDSVLTGRRLKSGKHYWPNICCKEESDAGKDSCIDPSGKIKREPCAVCGKEKAQAHHEDYSKHLDVVWLCTRHHADRHIYLRDQEALGIAPVKIKTFIGGAKRRFISESLRATRLSLAL